MPSINGLNFSGLATGIDTQKLVDGLLAVDKSRVSVLQTRQANVTLLNNTFDSLKTQVADLQTRAQSLGRVVNGPFDGRKVASSDEAIATAAAGSSAAPGTYSFVVKKLAKAHQIASTGLADQNALLQTGSFTLKVGTGATTTVNVNASNNTLQGVASAINASGADVTASVINDGSAQPYRLLLTSKKSGLSNNVQVDTSGLSGTGAALNLTQTIQSGVDAEVSLGDGAQAITINSATNKLESFIPGVTVNLVTADPAKTVTLTVSNDLDKAKTAITDFVDSYNKVVDFISSRTGYDAATKQGGLLLGNGDAYAIQNTIARAVGGVVDGVNQKANRLSALGITFDNKGKLSVDSAKLDAAFNGQIEGVGLDDVRRAFALAGTSSNVGVSFIAGTGKTLATADSSVGVKITSVATQGVLTGSAVGSLVIDSSNDNLNLTINGKSASIALTQKTYASVAELAQEIQGKIDGDATFGANLVSVRAESGALKITTTAYGSASAVKVTGGDGLTNLGFTANQTGTGSDVVGKFLVGGQEELATGKGQILTGKSGNETTDGLQVKVVLTQAQLDPSPTTPEAEVNVTVGLAAQLDRALNPSLDVIAGRFAAIKKGYTRDFDQFQKTIDEQNVRIAAKQASLVTRFAAMESAVSKLQALGTQLGAQFAGLSQLSAR